VPLGACVLASCWVLMGCADQDDRRRPRTPTAADPSSPPAIAGSGSGNVEVAEACGHTLARRVRRLSAREYLNVVGDLLGEDVARSAEPLLPMEPRIGGFDNQDVGLLVSQNFQEALFQIAEQLSDAVDPATLAPCAGGSEERSCLRDFAAGFGRKAYGRLLTADELERLLTAASAALDYPTAVRLIVQVVLQSPGMVYATELGADAAAAGDHVRLTPHEVASQLALVLTAARPDAELLATADADALDSPDERRAQVTRLLGTSRGQAQLRHLIDGWLDVGPIAAVPKDPERFPEFTPDVARAMQEELDRFIDRQLDGGRGSLVDLMTEPSDRIPDALVPFYANDLSEQGGKAAHRGGILSLPALLTRHSSDQNSSPIGRGLFVKRQLLCQPIPNPPASVSLFIAAHPIDNRDASRTTRMKYEAHVTDPFCATCHSLFDGIGFGMEQMDALGRYRTTEGGLPVDSRGELVGTDVDGPFEGVVELSQKLAQSELFKSCLTQHFFRFVEARVPQPGEQCLVAAWEKAFSDNGTRIDSLIDQWVSDPRFAERQEDR
jgi:hypothetical protein